MDGFMWIKHLTNFFTAIYTNPTWRVVLLTLYYLAIIVGLIIMYGRGNFTTPKFVYQGF
jgi:D-Ala-teichoic acid biosynthesis protein